MPFAPQYSLDYRFSIVRRPWLILLLALLPLMACGRYKARKELVQTRSFAEILKREDQRWIGNDSFFRDNLGPDRSPEVRQWSAIALARIGNPRALPWLYEALHGNDAALRAAAAFAIGQIEDRKLLEACRLTPDMQAVDELRRLLGDSSISVRMRAVEALGKVAPPAESAVLIGDLERFPPGESPANRLYTGAAITALARLENPLAAPVLERLAGSPNPELRQQASEALARLKALASAPLVGPGTNAADPPEECALRDSEKPAPGGGSVTPAVASALAASRKNSTIARVETSRGPIEIELFRGDAPVTVERFVLMAQGCIYDATEFAQAAPMQMIEAQGPQNRGGLRRLIRTEINMRPFERGSVGLALSSGGSDVGRFFIALAPQPYLDGVHTCFGRVVSGIQVADRLVPGDRILKIRIKETVNLHDYQRY